MDISDSESESLRTTGAFEDFRSPVMTEVDGLAGCSLWGWVDDGTLFVGGTGAVRELDWNGGKASSM